MFEPPMSCDLADQPDLAAADEATLAAEVSRWARAEAMAASRRLAAIAELTARRCSNDPDDRDGRSRWACDDWDGVAAEVSAGCAISHGKASGQMYLAVALRNRLPKVAALLAAGRITAALAATISWHTTLIVNPAVLALVDTALAADALRYGPLSQDKTAQAIDAIIETHDSAALRRGRILARSRDLVIDKRSTDHGTTPLWGRLYAHDAEALDRRLMAMAHGVCDDDPRTIAQRRADALGALAAGSQTLACACGNQSCPAQTAAETGADDTPAPGRTVIHVVAHAETVQSPTDAHRNGEESPTPPDGSNDLFAPARDPEPDPPPKAPPALVLGGPALPAPLVAELLARGAIVRTIGHPGPKSPPEPGYRPSAALDEFVRARDMTCRFPGCDRPAQNCDLDHAIAYPAGPTHPSNLRCLCRKHHLLKTFHHWRDRQRPDGSIEWTSPTGATYTTHPGSRLLFPSLCASTGALPLPAATTTARTPGHTLMMPTRSRTRAQNRARAITAERARNAKPPPQ
ncbi:hypothetical protein A5715_16700 [Mycolicibacter heraklionensis]|nr:hypothetical protein A5715_16700 [Mycolicibacter heraklionensis]